MKGRFMAKTTFNSSLDLLKQIQKKAKKLPDPDVHRQLLDVYATDLRALVDGVVDLKPAERKTYVNRYADLAKQLKPYNKKGYAPPPRLQMGKVARTFSVFLGWLKNRYKYKDGELNPPATDAQLQEFQDLMTQETQPPVDSIAYEEGQRGSFLPAAFVDSYRICNGMGVNVRMHNSIRILPLEIIIQTYKDLVSQERIFGKEIPFGDDGAGNYYLLSGEDVIDLNHEDNARTAVYPSLGHFLSKAHKVTR